MLYVRFPSKMIKFLYEYQPHLYHFRYSAKCDGHLHYHYSPSNQPSTIQSTFYNRFGFTFPRIRICAAFIFSSLDFPVSYIWCTIYSLWLIVTSLSFAQFGQVSLRFWLYSTQVQCCSPVGPNNLHRIQYPLHDSLPIWSANSLHNDKMTFSVILFKWRIY